MFTFHYVLLDKCSSTLRELNLKKKVKRLSHQCQRYAKKLDLIKTRKPSKQECIRSISHYLTGNALRFVKTQIKMSSTSAHGRRWSAHDKSVALSIFHASPKAYRILSKLFCLPSVQTLKKCVRNLDIYPGISENVIAAFRAKVSNFTKDQKLCVVAFDEIKLKPHVNFDCKRDVLEGLQDLGSSNVQNLVADHALVFYVRGLVEPWKQPFAYYLTHSTVEKQILAELLREVLRSILNLGLIPKAIVCDQGSNNRACLSGVLGVTAEKPYFKVEENTIVCFYDSPHLLKNIRNNLKRSGYTYRGNLIEWAHIHQFYQQDCKLGVRQAPKLTRKHFDLPGFSRMNVRMAAQILSHSVAKGMSLMSSFGALPPSAERTAEFCNLFDSLFNVFNSRCFRSAKKFASGLSACSDHWKLLDEAEAYLKELKPCSVFSQPCLNGWIQNIHALRMLHGSLSEQTLLTYRLNQDCVENFFSQVRGKGGHRDHPTCEEFRSAFRDLQIDGLLTVSARGNCQEDIGDLLFSFESLQGTQETVVPGEGQPSVSQTCDVSWKEHDYSLNSFVLSNSELLRQQELNVLAYIGGYLVNKIVATCCATCRSVVVADADTASHQLINLKNYSTSKGLIKPSDDLVTLLKSAEDTFNRNIDYCARRRGVRANLYRRILSACDGLFVDCISCKSKDAFLKLYLTVRLHHALKLFNQKLVDSTVRRASKKYVKLAS